jgi:PAS domain-containing protein
VTLEDEIRCADGSTFPVEVVVTHVRLGAKEVQCAILRDLTERKEGARRLADAHAFNASVLAAAPVGIVTYRQTGECVSCNETAAAIVGGTVHPGAVAAHGARGARQGRVRVPVTTR